MARFKIKRNSNSRDNSSVDRESVGGLVQNFENGSQEKTYEINY